MLKRFWKEEFGAIVSAEVMLVATILVIGVIVGLKSVRDSVATELADVAQAFGNVNQTYSYSATSGHHTFTAGGQFTDAADFCDLPGMVMNCEQQSKCVAICTSIQAPGGSTEPLN
ncbi:MAG: hypothetical protein K8U03_09380 [Planctomycetia bacterium]|nr:hypothetical protein [Planctomycetia bacterium]